MYTIGQLSEKLNIPISTLRYYDKVGLFPNLKRENGIRKFSDEEIESLQLIEGLKASGLMIKDIKNFIDLTQEGSRTYQQRKDLLENQKNKIEEEINRLNKARDLLKYKCWYYKIAIEDGNENHLNEIIPDKLPDDLKHIYDIFQIN